MSVSREMSIQRGTGTCPNRHEMVESGPEAILCTYQYFFPRGGGGGTEGIRQQINPNPRELDRTSRHGVGKLEKKSGSS